MGLFDRKSSKSKDKERLLGAKLADVRYTSVQELLIGEASLNSDDAKLVTIHFDDERTIKVWVADDKVVGAVDSAHIVSLREFLYWIDAPATVKSDLITKVRELSPTTLPLALELLSAQGAPSLNELLRSHVTVSGTEALLEASKLIATYRSVDTSIFKTKAVVNELARYGIALTALDENLTAVRKLEHDALQVLGVAEYERYEVLLGLGAKASSPESSEDKFILAAANAGSNLDEALELGDGFSKLELLRSLRRLVDTGEVELSYTVEDALELPELLSVPVKPYERVFTPTVIGDSLLPLVEKLFANSDWRESALALTNDNEKLEDRVNAIEDQLIKELADEEFAAFSELPGDVQASIRLLLKEREAHNAKREAILERLRENVVVEENEVSPLIAAKLAGIGQAGIHFDFSDVSTGNHDFELDEQELEFNAKDAVIGTDANGDPFIRDLAEGEDIEAEVQDAEKFLEALSEFQEDDEPVLIDSNLHAFEIDEAENKLSALEKAVRGPQPRLADGDTIPPIFLSVANRLAIDPQSIVR